MILSIKKTCLLAIIPLGFALQSCINSKTETEKPNATEIQTRLQRPHTLTKTNDLVFTKPDPLRKKSIVVCNQPAPMGMEPDGWRNALDLEQIGWAGLMIASATPCNRWPSGGVVSSRTGGHGNDHLAIGAGDDENYSYYIHLNTLSNGNNLIFDYKTSTETNYDFLRMYYSGCGYPKTKAFEMSGEHDWDYDQLTLPVCSDLTVTFSYEKDYSWDCDGNSPTCTDEVYVDWVELH